MAEIVDKANEDGILGYLDLQDDIERLLPGPSEKERNESRLRNLITGEPRPFEHINHESNAWAKANVGIPLLFASIKAAKSGGSMARGLNKISKARKFKTPGGLQANMRPAQKIAKESVKESKKALKEAKKDAPKKLFERLFYWINGGPSEEIWSARIAKKDAKNVDKAIKGLSGSPVGKPGDILDETITKTAKRAGAGASLGTKAADALSDNVGREWGVWDKGVDKNDDRLERSAAGRALSFINGLVGTDIYDPGIWPMDIINNLLIQTNAEANIWDKDQVENLGDDEKVKLVMDTVRGKYNDYEDVSNIMLKNYLRLMNDEE